MRHIIKTSAPKSLERWKAANKTKTYSDLGREQPVIKGELKQQLIREQKYICCYCERKINIESCHIEHFLPQDGETAKYQLDYTNMLISCNSKDTCGNKKDNVNNPDIISPTEFDSLSHFAFGVDGSIIGNDERGKFTINILNLKSQTLKEQRKALIDNFVYLSMGGINDEAEKYLIEVDGQFNKFHSMVEYLHKKEII